MLANTLNTNEVKDASGAEVEFSRISISDRNTVFAQIAESPARPHRLSINHQEVGAGLKRRRRSNNRVDLTVISDIDNVTPVTISAYTVVDAPVGALSNNTQVAKVLAELISFIASTGADTTIKYDGTGNGAVTLLSGSL